MSNQLDGFEKGLKSAFDSYQAPYENGSWERLQASMSAAEGGKGLSAGNALGVLAVVVAASAGLLLGWYFFSSDNAIGAKQASLNTEVLERASFDAAQRKGEMVGISEPVYADAASASDTELPANLIQSSDQSVAARLRDSANGQVQTAQSSALADAQTQPSSSSEEPIFVKGRSKAAAFELPAVGSMPAIPISISTREGCEGTSVHFNINTTGIDGNYLWNFGDGTFSNQANPSHTYTKAGVYDVTLSVTSNKDGVIRTKMMDQIIVINPNPDADFEWEFVDAIGEVPVVRFNNRSQRANQAQWVIVDSVTEEINPVMPIEARGAHWVELMVSNEFGCANAKKKLISVNEDYALMAPTRFSPNGDGVFDTFMPRALMTGEHRFTFIVSKGDDIIYETQDPSKSWSGILPDGTMAQPGDTFTWTAVVYKPKGDKFYSGSVAVVR
jgi:PKD repeat protein